MSHSSEQDHAGRSSDPYYPRSFPTTCWTLVLNAGGPKAAVAGEALEHLCRAYWYPLYAFVRRKGYAPHDAQDLTQGFFSYLLDKETLAKVAPEKGKFRTFLLTAMTNFLANEWDKEQAQKRGGGRKIQSLESEAAESRYQLEPSHDLTPERLYERQWAISLLDRVLANLRAEFEARGDLALFEELKVALTGNADSYAEVARRLGRSEGAVKVAVHRMRRRYRALVLAEVADTVADSEVEEELRHLFEIARG